jgi:hypothetical protein
VQQARHKRQQTEGFVGTEVHAHRQKASRNSRSSC